MVMPVVLVTADCINICRGANGKDGGGINVVLFLGGSDGIFWRWSY
jgi:hypothetical protein